MARHRILLVDDDPSIRFSVKRYLASSGFEVDVAETFAEGLAAFRAAPPDVAILDYDLPDGNGVELLGAAKAIDAGVPVLMLTGLGTIEIAVRAMKEGAEQFLTKPVDLAVLAATVKRAIETRRLERRQAAAASGQAARGVPDPFLGSSAAIRALAEQARRVAAAETPVLVTGPTGSGKGVLARWLHASGPRADEAMVDLNCAGLNRELLESELFGHERGSFTGAHAAKQGLLEAAHRGTLFLDEIGDMDPAVQPKLLKAVEEGRFRRVGEVRDRTVDVRLVAATHRDLPALVREGKFREDLFFRINAVPLAVPALRERPGDIPELAQWMVRERPACRGITLSEAAIASLQAYAWPGNIRELRNVLERAAVLARGPVLEPEDLRFDAPVAAPAPADDLRLTLEEVERRHVARVLEDVGGKVAAAAERLGIPRSTLYLKLKQYGIPTASGRE